MVERPRPQSPAILIVDDEPMAGFALQRFLQEHLPGWRILMESNPQAALARAQQRPVDIVIVDQVMDGMAGTEFLAVLRRLRPKVHRILITAYPVSVLGTTEIAAARPLKIFLKPVETTPFIEFLRSLVQPPGSAARWPPETHD